MGFEKMTVPSSEAGHENILFIAVKIAKKNEMPGHRVSRKSTRRLHNAACQSHSNLEIKRRACRWGWRRNSAVRAVIRTRGVVHENKNRKFAGSSVSHP